MSWDGILFRAPSVRSVNDFPSDFEMPPLGTTEEIGELLRQSFSAWTHSQGQSRVVGDGFSLTLSFQDRPSNPIVTSIGVRVGGFPGDEALRLLQQVCMALDVRFFDCQTGDFADFDVETRRCMQDYSEWVARAMAPYNPIDPNSAEGQGFEP